MTSIQKWYSHPGETVKDIMDERNLSVEDVMSLIGQPKEVVLGILSGETEITAPLAHDLSQGLGSSPGFWYVREQNYRHKKAEHDRLGLDANGKEICRAKDSSGIIFGLLFIAMCSVCMVLWLTEVLEWIPLK